MKRFVASCCKFVLCHIFCSFDMLSLIQLFNDKEEEHMFFGLDRNDNRVFIEDALSRGDYFCPTCGKPLVVKKGDVNIHHFAHWPKHKCTDDWNNPSSKKEG